MRGYYQLANQCLKIGMNPNVQDEFGNTALHYAVRNSYFDLAELLMKKGANESIQNVKGDTCWQAKID